MTPRRSPRPSPLRTVEYANYRVDGYLVLIARDHEGNRIREQVLRPDVDEQRTRRAFWLALDMLDPIPELTLVRPAPAVAQEGPPVPLRPYSVGVALMLARRGFNVSPR